jgi:hypothetical protein
MQSGESLHDLHEDIPYFFLLELSTLLLVLKNLLEKISSVGILHDYAV